MSFDGLILHLNVCLTIQRFFLLFVKKISFNWYLSWNIWNKFGNDISKLYLQQLMSWSIFFFQRERESNFVFWGNQSLIFSNLTTFLRNQCDKCMFESSLGREVHVSGFPRHPWFAHVAIMTMNAVFNNFFFFL